MDMLIGDGEDTACSVGIWDAAIAAEMTDVPWADRRKATFKCRCR